MPGKGMFRKKKEPNFKETVHRSVSDRAPDKPPVNGHVRGWDLNEWHKRGRDGHASHQVLKQGHKKMPVNG